MVILILDDDDDDNDDDDDEKHYNMMKKYGNNRSQAPPSLGKNAPSDGFLFQHSRLRHQLLIRCCLNTHHDVMVLGVG